MTLTQVWGAFIVILICPLVGSMPITYGLIRLLAKKNLAQVGTGNIGVSAAFYHGGRWVGLLAVIVEALKGIGVVLVARYFFPDDPTWELIAMMALVIGRYWSGQGAGTTNVTWGYVVHDWRISGMTLFLSGISFTLLRQRKLGKYIVLILLPLLTLLLYPNNEERIIAAAALSLLMAWIYQRIPDDLDLSEQEASTHSKGMFQFLRGDRSARSLQQSLQADKVGSKAATLAQLYQWGYPVPMGWVLQAGDDPAAVAEAAQPSGSQPVVVRSSAVGEDSETASAAGQYQSMLNIASPEALQDAIVRCLNSYNAPSAIAYRQEHDIPDAQMAVLVQRQIDGAFSGVAFSRDPITCQGDAVVIEALPGGASRVVSGRETPELYRVWITQDDFDQASAIAAAADSPDWFLPEESRFDLEGEGDVPPRLIQQVAFLVRHLEACYHGVPQDLEWTFDGQKLWVLQSRPVTTLLPIWTRKIAAEVIPGTIHPLTWSINRPLTCGVWGDLFTLVLADRVQDLDFEQTATLHHSYAYFNASLLGQIFRRMGLPAESLEFLTRGAKFSRPPLLSTLKNSAGLWRLLRREMRLPEDFERDNQQQFQPKLAKLSQDELDTLSPVELLTRMETLLDLLRSATYYSILAPLSLAVRQGVFKVPDAVLNRQQSPEVESIRALRAIADENRSLVLRIAPDCEHSSSVFAALAESPDGQAVLNQIDRFLADYGYLSEVATDIAVPRWQENQHAVREMFTQFVLDPQDEVTHVQPEKTTRQIRNVQQRLDLKGQVTQTYSRILAALRYTLVALGRHWREIKTLDQTRDIFFLELDEVRQLVADPSEALVQQIQQRIAVRKTHFAADQEMTTVPNLVYGNEPPLFVASRPVTGNTLRGIGASPGQVEGQVLVLKSFQAMPTMNPETILVVPHTDAGWAPLLARAAGFIAEVGGRLSHGAIVAREYRIPAVMNVQDAMNHLKSGQWVRLDGSQGTVEILDNPSTGSE
ncbi:MAG: glycerol-3-phosphate acyltransferase [Thainema sp.]